METTAAETASGQDALPPDAAFEPVSDAPPEPAGTTLAAIGELRSPAQVAGVQQALVGELATLTDAWQEEEGPTVLRPGFQDVADRLRLLGKASARLSGGRESARLDLQAHARHADLARFFGKHPKVAEEARQAFSAAGLTDCDGWQAVFEGVVVPAGEEAR